MDLPEPTSAEVRWTFKRLGACALILTFALAYGIVHKVNASDAALQSVVRIAASSSAQVDRLTAQIDEQNRMSAERSKQASKERDQQLAEIGHLQRLQQHQAALFIKILRRNGIAVPKNIFVSPGSSTRPKGTRPTNRATPSTTAPSPTPSPVPLYCQLVPALCDGLPLGLPTISP